MDPTAVVLVTNVGGGFGRAVALAYGRAGCDVVCADHDVGLASKTAAEVEEAGGQAIPLQTEMTVQLDIQQVFTKVDEIFGAVTGIVHVAARESHSRASHLSDAEFTELLEDSLRSSQLILRTAARLLDAAWVVLVAPPGDAQEPQMAMVRGALARLAGAFDERYAHLRVNVVVPSRGASDPTHDDVFTRAVQWLGSSASEGVRGIELPVDLPPPPRVVEAMLPEVQAALDDRVRQDDLEANHWGDDAPPTLGDEA